MSDWREIHGDQNLRMAQKMLEQQGEIAQLRETLTLVEQFERVRAAIDAEGVVANAATPGPWVEDGRDVSSPNRRHDDFSRLVEGSIYADEYEWEIRPEDRAHIVLQDPDRTRRRLERDRLILQMHEGSHDCTSVTDSNMWISGDDEGGPCATVLAIAEDYQAAYVRPAREGDQ